MTRAIGSMLLLAALFAAEPARAADDPVAKGAQVYKTLRCSMCHKIQGSGGKVGPDLTDVGTRRDAAWLTKYLPNPKGTIPGSKMPPAKASPDDLAALVAYLASLKSGK